MAETRESWGKELSHPTETHFHMGGAHFQMGCKTFFSTWVDQGKGIRGLCVLFSPIRSL